MGRNNIENRSNDKNWGRNLTKRTNFKFEIMSEQYCRKFELAQGLEFNKLTLTIKLNAKYKIAQSDKLNIKGRMYMVVTTSDNFENPEQGKYKGSLNDFTGSLIVGLE